MDGHETWEETLSGTYGTPELAFAPEAGRFALSRIMSPTGDLNFGQVIPDGASQEVRVYQTESGDLLLKVPTTPVTRYAENFDLSEDGMLAAVVNAGVIQVYKLPQPSAQDVKDLAEAKSFSPPASKAPVSFARLAQPESGDGGSESSSAGADVAAAMTPDMGNAAASGTTASASTGSGGGSGLSAPPLAAAGAAGPTQGGLAVAPPGTEVTKASAAADTSGISDEEAEKALGASRVAVAGPAAKAGPDGAGAKAAAASADPAAKDGPGAGDGDSGKRKPPTLLEPGENVEKVKAPAQQQQPSK
jgi:hypothetical protein